MCSNIPGHTRTHQGSVPGAVKQRDRFKLSFASAQFMREEMARVQELQRGMRIARILELQEALCRAAKVH